MMNVEEIAANARKGGRKPLLFTAVELYVHPDVKHRHDVEELIEAHGGTLLQHHVPTREVGEGSFEPGRRRAAREAFTLVDPSPSATIAYQNFADVISSAYVVECVQSSKSLSPFAYSFSWKVRSYMRPGRAGGTSNHSSGRRRGGRTPYTMKEDARLYNFVQRYSTTYSIGGNALWKLAAKKGVTERTWQSMKDRYRVHILKFSMSKIEELKAMGGEACGMMNEEQAEAESVRNAYSAQGVPDENTASNNVIPRSRSSNTQRAPKRARHDVDDHDDHDDEISKLKAALTLERRKNAKLMDKVATLHSELAAARGVRQDVMVNSEDEGFI